MLTLLITQGKPRERQFLITSIHINSRVLMVTLNLVQLLNKESAVKNMFLCVLLVLTQPLN